jgi:diketogulonate reductase-like aldo/keto reductase
VLLYAGLAAQYAARRIGLLALRPRRKDFSYMRMTRSLEQSLRNLRSDYVDLYLAHDISENSPGLCDDLAGELVRVREAGKARFIGFAGRAADCLTLAKKYPRVADILQVEVQNPPPQPQGHDLSAEQRITFGYFRNALKGSRVSDRSAILRRCAELAVLENPNGVILFSAGSVARIDEMLSAFDFVEASEAR